MHRRHKPAIRLLFQKLSDIDDKRARFRGRLDPRAVRVENLETRDGVLQDHGEPAEISVSAETEVGVGVGVGVGCIEGGIVERSEAPDGEAEVFVESCLFEIESEGEDADEFHC